MPKSTMQVPFLDIPAQNRAIQAELDAALRRVIDEAQFILGPAVEQFERRFAQYLGVPHCVGLNNGTSALHMALHACDIGPGDEVITTAMTWISTAWAISYRGATPVFVDIDPVTYNIDAAQVQRAITPRTKAILPVHLYGRCADMHALAALADRHGLLLIEDAAQAHGARVEGRCAGVFGVAGCFSFYPGKNLGAFGEAGAAVTHDPAMAQRIRQLRDHAQQSRHHHVELGYNTRMEGIQGAVLGVKLAYLDAWNQRRRELARRYHGQLADIEALVPPAPPKDAQSHVWHLYVVQLRDGDRDALREALAKRGIATAVHYPTPVPLQLAYAQLGHSADEFPHAVQLARRCLSLPMAPQLSDDQIDYTVQALKELL